MDIIGLDGKIYKWNPLNSERVFASSSSYHEKARELVKELFPFDVILEEVDLAGTRTRTHDILRADFYIPKAKILIEVHGEQHYKFSKLFHGDISEFKRSQLKDRDKENWCVSNNIKYIALPYYESIEEWKNRICQQE